MTVLATVLSTAAFLFQRNPLLNSPSMTERVWCMEAARDVAASRPEQSMQAQVRSYEHQGH